VTRVLLATVRLPEFMEGAGYHLGAWAAILRGAYGFRPRYLASQKAGRLTGVLPLMGKKGIVSDARLRERRVVAVAYRYV
jgi:hypothetical protein